LKYLYCSKKRLGWLYFSLKFSVLLDYILFPGQRKKKHINYKLTAKKEYKLVLFFSGIILTFIIMPLHAYTAIWAHNRISSNQENWFYLYYTINGVIKITTLAVMKNVNLKTEIGKIIDIMMIYQITLYNINLPCHSFLELIIYS